MENQIFNSWGVVLLIIVVVYTAMFLLSSLVKWRRSSSSFSKKMSIIADKLSWLGLYGKISTRVRIEDGWVEFQRQSGFSVARVTVHDVDNKKFILVSCNMSDEVVSIFREVLSTDGSGLNFRHI